MTTTPIPGTFISMLPTATSLTGTELVPVVQGGTTKTATAAQLLSGSASFLGLSDTPKTYIAQALKGLRVNSTNTAVEFAYGYESSVVNVKDFGAKGDGTTDDTTAIQNAINACFVTVLSSQLPSPTGANKILFFPQGLYKITSHLQLNGIWGGVIMGAGNLTTVVKNFTASDSVFNINGFNQCVVRDIEIMCSTGGTCVNLDWDGSTYINTSENIFENVTFSGPSKNNGSVGLAIGRSGFQASETLVMECLFNGHTIGMATYNDNAINQMVIGGGGGSNGSQYAPQTGNINYLMQLSLANNDTDLDWTNGRASPVAVIGCRTESTNFIKTSRGKFFVSGCEQSAATGGVFFNDGGHEISHIDCCNSENGQIGMYGGGHVSNTDIGRDDWFNTGGGTAHFTFENIYKGKTSGGVGTGTQVFLAGHGFVVAGVAYQGFPSGTASTMAPLVQISSGQVLVSNNNNDGVYIQGASNSSIGVDCYQGQHNTIAFLGGGNNYPTSSNGMVITEYYGYANNSLGVNHNLTYAQLNAEIDNVTSGSEAGRWTFLGYIGGVANTQMMRVGNGVIVGSGTTFPGQGNLTASGTLATGVSSVGGLPAAGTKGRRYFVTDASTNTFATIVAGGGTFNVPVWDNGTNWMIG